MASLMTLTHGHVREIRSGRWMVICKTQDYHGYNPEWTLIGIDGRQGDHLMLTGEQGQIANLRILSLLDNHARVFSVRETEPIKTVFMSSGAVKTLCEAIRKIYDEQLGLSLNQVLLDNGLEALHDAASGAF